MLRVFYSLENDLTTLTNPVRLSKLTLIFLTSPNSENLSKISSSAASSCTPVTSSIQPSTAAHV